MEIMTSKLPDSYFAIVPQSWSAVQAVFASKAHAREWAENNAERPYRIVLLDAKFPGDLTEIPTEVKVIFDSDDCAACCTLHKSTTERVMKRVMERINFLGDPEVQKLIADHRERQNAQQKYLQECLRSPSRRLVRRLITLIDSVLVRLGF